MLVVVTFLSELPVSVLTFEIFDFQMHLHMEVVIPSLIKHFVAFPKGAFVDKRYPHIIVITIRSYQPWMNRSLNRMK